MFLGSRPASGFPGAGRWRPFSGLNGVGGSNPRLGGEAACGGGLGLKQQLSIGT
jgi:hypothetical protein